MTKLEEAKKTILDLRKQLDEKDIQISQIKEECRQQCASYYRSMVKAQNREREKIYESSWHEENLRYEIERREAAEGKYL